MQWWQLRLSSSGRKPLFADEDACRKAVLAVARGCGPALLLFCLVDDHLHLALQGDRQRVAVVGRSLHRVTAGLSGLDLEPAWTEEISSRSHLMTLLRYYLTQPDHHGLAMHPALWSGSCLHDIIQTRWVEGFSLCLASALPRVRAEYAFEVVGLDSHPLRPPAPDRLAMYGLPRLVSAAAAAACVPVAMEGNSPATVRARSAVARLAMDSGFTRAQVGDALRCTRRSVGQVIQREPALAMETAILRRLGLEDRVASRR